jgi:predicted nucleic acid-binding Zn ribbon protein
VEPIGNVIAEIVSRKGIGRRKSTEQRQNAWRQAVGEEMAKVTRVGEIRRLKLEVIVASSIVMQELSFQKQDILSRLRASDQDLQIDDLRFQVGSVVGDG